VTLDPGDKGSRLELVGQWLQWLSKIIIDVPEGAVWSEQPCGPDSAQ
jgi:hypothetical protein